MRVSSDVETELDAFGELVCGTWIMGRAGADDESDALLPIALVVEEDGSLGSSVPLGMLG